MWSFIQTDTLTIQVDTHAPMHMDVCMDTQPSARFLCLVLIVKGHFLSHRPYSLLCITHKKDGNDGADTF